MKIYQLNNKLKKQYINIDTKGVRNLKDLIKLICSNKDLLELIRKCKKENKYE